MRARLLNGYWCFKPPTGYAYKSASGQGRVLVRDEPVASILQEAMEGFASGRFETQSEMKRFLESCPDYPKNTADGEIHRQRIHDILKRPVYAGYVEYAEWNVSLRKGQHEGLISLETFQKIQARLAEGAKAPARKDIHVDFPLRGFVLCHDCGNPLTACWSKSRTGKRHPYYLCQKKGCESRGKSIRRDVLEGDFVGVLRSLRPTEKLYKLARLMFQDAWMQRQQQAAVQKEAMRRDILTIESQIEGLLDRIVDAQMPSVISAYEKRIDALEKEKLLMTEKLEKEARPAHTFEDLFELAFGFLKNPCKLWDSGQLSLQRLVLRLVFSERISYCRDQGIRTTDLSLPFKMLTGLQIGNLKMVGAQGLEPWTC